MNRYLRNLAGAFIVALLGSVAIYLMVSFTMWLYLVAFNGVYPLIKILLVMILSVAIVFALIKAAMRIMSLDLLREDTSLRGSDLLASPVEGETLRAYTLRHSIYLYELAAMFTLLCLLGAWQFKEMFHSPRYDLLALFTFALPLISVMTFVAATTELVWHMRLRHSKDRKVYSKLYDEGYDMYFYDFVDKTH